MKPKLQYQSRRGGKHVSCTSQPNQKEPTELLVPAVRSVWETGYVQIPYSQLKVRQAGRQVRRRTAGTFSAIPLNWGLLYLSMSSAQSLWKCTQILLRNTMTLDIHAMHIVYNFLDKYLSVYNSRTVNLFLSAVHNIYKKGKNCLQGSVYVCKWLDICVSVCVVACGRRAGHAHDMFECVNICMFIAGTCPWL